MQMVAKSPGIIRDGVARTALSECRTRCSDGAKRVHLPAAFIYFRPVGVHGITFKARSGITQIMAYRIAQPRKGGHCLEALVCRSFAAKTLVGKDVAGNKEKRAPAAGDDWLGTVAALLSADNGEPANAGIRREQNQ